MQISHQEKYHRRLLRSASQNPHCNCVIATKFTIRSQQRDIYKSALGSKPCGSMGIDRIALSGRNVKRCVSGFEGRIDFMKL